jgi:hypothetical protein
VSALEPPRYGPAVPRPTRYRALSSPAISVLAGRLVAFGGLATFCALHWAALVAPYASDRMLAAVAAGAIGGVALATAASLEPRPRRIVVGVALLAMALTALALSGIPLKYVGWHHWDELSAGVSDGVAALPGTTVPYHAADPWPGIAIVAGGTLIVMIAAVLAFWPRSGGRERLGHPWAALIVLCDLYAVPVIERNLPHQHARGAAFAALVLCYIALERVRPERAGPMVIAAMVAALAGLAIAPRLDGSHSWLDYNSIAESFARNDTVAFNWNHTYGPLDWPRDGTVMLRIKAPKPAYWKAENLDIFDGLRWVANRASASVDPRAELPPGSALRRDWTEKIRVTVRSLRSDLVVGAGTTLAVDKLGRRPATPGHSAGTFEVGRALGRGDSYEAEVYAPRPTAAQLRDAGTSYPGFTEPYSQVLFPGRSPSEAGSQVTFSPFASGHNGVFLTGFVTQGSEADGFLEQSAYSRMWAISHRLALRSATPYAYARAIEGFLGKGFRYTETPKPAAVPLEAFVARDRAGYCQQFSGAMALMLRMGGVPARVASGFTTGDKDKSSGDYVVEDINAHSWVEAYFPTIGWVPFDPTPAAAPARGGGAGGLGAGLGGPIPGGRAGLGEDATTGAFHGSTAKPARGGVSFATVALIAAGGLALLALLAVAVLRSRRRPGLHDPSLSELERALRRSGRPLAPSTTLADLEARLGPGARGYLAALRSERFASGAAGPSATDRTELRRELARGLGATGRLRGLWALPPRPRTR